MQEKTDIRYYVYLPIHFEKKRKEYDKSFQLSEKKKSDLFVSMEGIMPESENITQYKKKFNKICVAKVC